VSRRLSFEYLINMSDDLAAGGRRLHPPRRSLQKLPASSSNGAVRGEPSDQAAPVQAPKGRETLMEIWLVQA
jgi:hypothetical protein